MLTDYIQRCLQSVLKEEKVVFSFWIQAPLFFLYDETSCSGVRLTQSTRGGGSPMIFFARWERLGYLICSLFQNTRSFDEELGGKVFVFNLSLAATVDR